MEVLGTVAACGQLIGTAIKILDSIAQLRDYLRHAPARHRGWHTELAALHNILSYIRHHSNLQTCQVKGIIESIDFKIATLTNLCGRYMPVPNQQLFIKLNRALSARTVESKILQGFESLEHDKTTLLLVISTLRESTSAQSSSRGLPEIQDMQDTIYRENTTKTRRYVSPLQPALRPALPVPTKYVGGFLALPGALFSGSFAL
ncbi:hypothetical protein F4804DRAFT_322778 [Jackrogersella minutella]|nr:hypothetical protein F4804DRAFT_322778 [Jackrogersella minutella]